MKIEISQHGILWVDNKEKMCPWVSEIRGCGDWCALFSAPAEAGIPKMIYINLCHQSHTCPSDSFIDEREKS